jgi:hypothetical protein
MNNFFVWLLGALLVFLTSWGGIQKRKVAKAESRANEAERRAKDAEQGLKVSETASKAKDEIAMKQKLNSAKKDEIQQQIVAAEQKEGPDEKSKEQERIANGITDLFNSRNHSL